MKLGSFLMKNIKTFRSEILASVNTVYEHMIPQPDWEMGIWTMEYLLYLVLEEIKQ